MTSKRLCQLIAVLSLTALISMFALDYMALESGLLSPEQPNFEATGRTSKDVLTALAALGDLNTEPSDATSSLAQQAIKQAERRHGLQPDGAPDKTLLERLVIEIEERRVLAKSSGGFSLDDWSTIVQIASGVSFIIFGFLGLLGLGKQA